MTSFIHLHVHSHFSLCQGANAIQDYVARAAKCGMTHLAMTDTNGLYGLGWFLEAARTHNIQPIIGAYLKTDKNQCIMLAKNHAGYRCLCRAIRHIHMDSQFDLPNYLNQQARNVVILSSDIELLNACLGLSDLYAELIPHENRERVLRFAKSNDLPVVATNAVYFLDKSGWTVHQLLRAIDLNTSLDRVPNRELASGDAYFTTLSEMISRFPDNIEAINNTQMIANDCTFTLRFDDFIFTSFESAQAILEKKVIEGVYWRYGQLAGPIKKRMDYELLLINNKKFAPYFLVVADIVRQAPRTCGRGSAAASLVSYSLGITHVDPICYDLFFDRFLNPGRIDPPDIDVDFPWDERDDVLDYIFRKYGDINTAMIANHNCFKARSAVREVAKVYGIPESEINQVTKKMSGYYQPTDILSLTKTHPVYKDMELDSPWQDIIQNAEKIRGFPRNLSVHCGGVVIAPDGLDNYVPVQPAKKILSLTGILNPNPENDSKAIDKKRISVIQWEKDQAEDMGLIKIDILGNRSLAVIRDALQAVKANYNVDINYSDWNPLNDKKTINLLAKGETIGVFYVESPAMRQLQVKTQKGDFEHLVIHSSIIRPAANEYINEYVNRLKGKPYTPLHPRLKDILAETFGIMVYQEDVSRVAMALAGFDSVKADELRKVISKKHKKKKLIDLKRDFYKGANQNGVKKEVCNKVWDMIESFSGYSFCKPHSASYALVSFKSAYLRAHYPAEFIASVISNQGGYYSTFAYISEARRMGLKILGPHINLSKIEYIGYQNKVRIGLMQIKDLSYQAKETIVRERDNHGEFQSFDDFMQRVSIAPSDVSFLIKAGCFDELEPKRTRPELTWRLKCYYAERRTQTSQVPSLFDNQQLPQKQFPNLPNFNRRDVIKQELETMGFLISCHPLSLYNSKLKRIPHVKGKDLPQFLKKAVRMIGWMITRKTVSTKTEQMMEFISFEDTTAIYETVFFPETYAKFVYMMSSTRPYILEGTVEADEGAFYLNVSRVRYLD